MSSIKVLSVNISKEKGTIKHPVEIIRFTETGIENDAHSGNWHRQVSLLSIDSIKTFEIEAKRKVEFGEFAENITVEGMKVYKTNILDRFENDSTILEVTQLGKKCHGTGCAIYTEVGNCIMPKEGIFCRVIKGNELTSGETLEYFPKVFKICINNKYSEEYSDIIVKEMENYFNSINRKYSISINPSKKDVFDIVFEVSFKEINEGNKSEFTPMAYNKDIINTIEILRTRYKVKDLPASLNKSLIKIDNQTLMFSIPSSSETIFINDITKVLISLIYISKGL